MVVMTGSVWATSLGSEFDDFLFAPIAEESNGMLLSVISALARLDLDPWQEAIKLAGLPRETATKRLASLLIAALTGGPSAHLDPGTIAARLIALLPRRASSSVESRKMLIGTGEATKLRARHQTTRNAEAKSLTAISAEMRDFAESARARKLKPNEYQGGASAISNLGMYGVREFSAIINPPHTTILAVGATRRAPGETEDGRMKFISQLAVTLSCDHRVVDGALGAELMKAFKKLIEKPVMMVV
jgi:hypothetical protein